MAAFPEYLFTPCPCLHRSSDQTSIWKNWTDLSSAGGFLSDLVACIYLVLSNQQELSDFAKAFCWDVRKGFDWKELEFFSKKKNKMTTFSDMWNKNTTWMWLYHETSLDLNSWEKDLLHYTIPPKQEIPAALMKFYFLNKNTFFRYEFLLYIICSYSSVLFTCHWLHRGVSKTLSRIVT